MKVYKLLWPFFEARAREARGIAEYYGPLGNALAERENKKRAWLYTRTCLILEALEHGQLEKARDLACEEITTRRAALK